VYVSVARSWSSIVAQWRGLVATHLIFGVPATIALVVLCMLLARRAQRDRTATAALQAERQQRETAEEALRQAQKMEAVGRLTAGIAHDFNNHLTVISSNIELLKRRMPPDAHPLVPLADAAMQGVQRAAALTHRLLAFARQRPAEPEPVDMARLIDGMAALLRTALGDTVVVEIHGSNGLWQTRADASQMESAILHLAVNARDAMPAGGELTIDVANVQLDAAYVARHAEATEGGHVMVAVADTGVGMTPDVAARACEPFFTTKPLGKGVGVGLSMVNGLVRQSGGHMTIASRKGRGTTVTLYLPRYVPEHAAAVAPAPKAPAAAAGDAGETVLVVEDDEAIRRSSVQALHEIGYQVLEAPDAMEAIRLIADRGGIDLLFTDVGLPGGVDGRTLADAARTASPAIRILFTTGYARYAMPGGCGSGGHFLAKPFTLEELGVKVREVLDAAATVAPAAPVSG
jgi:signal transduction histidine kinase/ActR/RegA family two-component response regulator